MGKKVELLEDHAGLRADLLDVADIAREGNAVDDNVAGLVLFETVDATNESGLAGAGGADDDNYLLGPDAQAAVFEGLKFTEPFADILADDDLVRCSIVGHFGGVVFGHRPGSLRSF